MKVDFERHYLARFKVLFDLRITLQVCSSFKRMFAQCMSRIVASRKER